MNKKLLIILLILGFILPIGMGAQVYYSGVDQSYLATLQTRLDQLRAELNSLLGNNQYGYNYSYNKNTYPYQNYTTYSNYGYPTGAVLGTSTYNPYASGQCNFVSNLSYGDSGVEVQNLQRVLGQYGFGNITESGYFNSQTLEAVKNFQNAYAYEILYPVGYTSATGIVGPMTRAKLNQVCNNVNVMGAGAVLGASTYNPYYSYNPNQYSYTSGTATLSFSASSNYVNRGGNVTLTWSGSNLSTCRATNSVNGWSGDKYASGSVTLYNLQNTVTYNIECTGYNGQKLNQSVTVSVSGSGSSTSYPTVSLWADNTSVPSGGPTVLRWSTIDATSCNASGSWSGSQSIGSGSWTTNSIYSPQTYILTCINGNNSRSASVTVNVN